MIFAVIAIALGCLVSMLNWASLIQSAITKKLASPVPLIGALFLGLGLSYFEKARPYVILSIIADYGTLVLIISLPRLIREFWVTRRFNLVRTCVANSQNAKYELRLYRKGVFVINVKFEPPQTANEHGAKISEFGLQGKWEEGKDVIECHQYADDRILRLIDKGDSYLAKESNYPQDRKYRYDHLNGIRFMLSSQNKIHE